MQQTARIRAARLVERLLAGRGGTPPPEGSDEGLDSRDARLAAELAHGVVRHLMRIDWIIAHAAGKPTDRMAPAALAAARLGAYQLLFTASIPAYAAVSESVDLARALDPKSAGFVNWLLRRIGPDAAALPRREDFSDELAWLGVLHSFPPWLVRRWTKRLGVEEAVQLLEAMNEHPPPHVRVNRLRSSEDAAIPALAAEGFSAEPGHYAPDSLHVRGSGHLTGTALFRSGALYLQDESSQLAARVLAPRPGERILDACAGVGGKTTQIAELAGNSATIVAVDRDERRLAHLYENAARLGAAGIEARRGDFLDPALLLGERFDAVLLDAPCSALGTIPRHPEVKWSKRAGDPRRLADLQLQMLARLAGLVSPGGRIVYSTCSTEPEEGEEVIARFLASHPAFSVGLIGDDAVNLGIRNIDELLTPEGYLRTWPHRHRIGGAFISLIQHNA